MTSGLGINAYAKEEAGEESVQVKKPHVILIMTDQHRGDALGCMGNTAVISPNLDRLAKEGTLFVNGYSASPSSTPARAGLLTGMSPWHHGMLGYGQVAEKYTYECRKCCVISVIIHLVSGKCTGSRKRLFMVSMLH